MGPKTERAYRTILQWITSGQQPPGSSLPPERTLTEKLDIGRTALRQALARLVAEGKLEVHDRSAYTVPAPPPDTVKVQPVTYTVSVFPEGHRARRYFTLTLEYRGEGMWAVKDDDMCLDRDGNWSYELRTSKRGAEWLAAHRFDFETARALAVQAAPHLNVNGRSAAEVLAQQP